MDDFLPAPAHLLSFVWSPVLSRKYRFRFPSLSELHGWFMHLHVSSMLADDAKRICPSDIRMSSWKTLPNPIVDLPQVICGPRLQITIIYILVLICLTTLVSQFLCPIFSRPLTCECGLIGTQVRSSILNRMQVYVQMSSCQCIVSR